MSDETYAPGTGGDPQLFGMVAEFATTHDLLAAAAAVRQAGFTRFDTHTPFPVHGMDRAMGLPESKLPWLVFAGGMTGVTSAVVMQWWMNAFDYPIRVGGKPFFSYQSYVPIGFELTVLLGSFCAVFGLLALIGLPRPYHPLFTNPRFARHSDDGFFLSIEAADPRWDVEKARRVLQEAGGGQITLITDISESLHG